MALRRGPFRTPVGDSFQLRPRCQQDLGLRETDAETFNCSLSLLRTYYVPGSVPGAVEMAMDKTGKHGSSPVRSSPLMGPEGLAIVALSALTVSMLRDNFVRFSEDENYPSNSP